ncbi:hypothetical protein NONS58_27780 [Nitrosococcus oceani]|nr:hypothetical protein NONS58_27780 [Nitrosococcus oceani]
MKRQEFLKKLTAAHRMFGLKNLIYMDETGFDAPCDRDAGWVQKGHKILGLITGKRKRRTHLIMAQRHTPPRGRKKKGWRPCSLKAHARRRLLKHGLSSA